MKHLYMLTLGFMLLKEALENAMKDKMTAEDKLAAAQEMKSIPFTSLLKHVLGDDEADEKQVCMTRTYIA